MASSEPRGRIWTPDTGPLRTADLEGVVGDSSVAERKDGPRRPSETTGSNSARWVTGEGLDWSDVEILEFVVRFRPLWEAGEAVEQQIKKKKGEQNRAGRKRIHSVSGALLFVIAAKVFGGHRAAEKNLRDKKHWKRLRRAVARAYPDDPDRRLPRKPIKRHHFDYMRDQFICEKLNEQDGGSIEELAEHMFEAAFEAAVDTGMLDPDAGSLTHPYEGQVVAGDGTWVRALYKASERDCVEAAAKGRKLRFDADAVAYHDENSRGGARGFEVVFGSCRNAFRQERITLFADIRPKGMTDATFFRHMILRAKRQYPDLTKGLKAITYDMAASSEDCDAFKDAGIIPVVKVPRTSTGHAAKVNLGEHTFKLRSGEPISMPVVAVDGPPTIQIIDSDGEAHTVPLTRNRNKKNPHKQRCTFYGRYKIPDDDLIPDDLLGATTTIRYNSTDEEREAKPHRRRSRALRIISEADEDFDRLYGLREDTESNNSQYKQTLHLNRARTVGTNRLRLDLLAYQMKSIVTTLVAHSRRTGTSPKGWFGDSPPP